MPKKINELGEGEYSFLLTMNKDVSAQNKATVHCQNTAVVYSFRSPRKAFSQGFNSEVLTRSLVGSLSCRIPSHPQGLRQGRLRPESVRREERLQALAIKCQRSLLPPSELAGKCTEGRY